MVKHLQKAILGVTLALVAALSIGFISAFSTINKYQFHSHYAGVGHESFMMTQIRGRIKMQYFGYNIDNDIVVSKQFYGLFLRYGAHYFVLAKEQNTADHNQHLTARSYFIESNGENAILISDQRGVFITKSKTPLHLNSVLTGSVV
ncbi:hypothetical protein C9I98_21885 [Photobacterium sanctipauli]|uniref:Uncharacterized protein n=1 Tax=Photobacterium sanctipauli TaxID=1342794 RepID=A0A2T3NII6_9GAMM|nr:hypothetical protein [Photobacterium sanctipauli]PSW14835.1 hypothetical protein C9I98_21885 [Photobacterium sanctipauli]